MNILKTLDFVSPIIWLRIGITIILLTVCITIPTFIKSCKPMLTCITIDDIITDNTDNTVLVNNTSRTDTEQWDMYWIHNTRDVPDTQYVSDT